jgi:hypothetical protein
MLLLVGASKTAVETYYGGFWEILCFPDAGDIFLLSWGLNTDGRPESQPPQKQSQENYRY